MPEPRTGRDGVAAGRRRRWLAIGLVGGWALIVLALAVWASASGPATVRAQSDLATGRQALDRAVETLRERAGTPVEVGQYEVTTGCRLSVARRGTEVERVVTVRVPAGTEPAALAGLAERVPAEWSAQYFTRSGRLRADAGDFVTVVGEATGPGELRLTVSTGCRPGSDPGLPDDQ